MCGRISWFRIPLFVFILLLPAVASAQQALLTDDTFVILNQPNTVHGNDVSLSVGIGVGENNRRHGYLKFSFSTLPIGTTGNQIRNATLLLWVNTVTSSPAFDVKPVMGSWTEATLNASNAPALGVTVVEASSVGLGYKAVDLTTLVKQWLDGTTVNNGIALIPTGVFNFSVSFDSKDKVETGHPPQLTVNLVTTPENVFPGP